MMEKSVEKTATKGFDLSSFKIDKKKSLEGVWEPLGNGTEILVARIGNKKYQEAYANIPKGVRRMLENKTLADETAEEIYADVLSQTILLNWKNMNDEGKPIEYSTEAAQAMLQKYEPFRELVWELANDFQTFHDNAQTADVKNSKSASSGT